MITRIKARLSIAGAGSRLYALHRLSTLHGIAAYDPRARRTRLAGPLQVQLQTIDRCNAACGMCPYSTKARAGAPNSMSDQLFTRVARELRRVGTVRSICLMLQSEPLLDRHLERRFLYLRQLFGARLSLALVTNGSALTPARIEGLRRAAVDSVIVSIDASDEETFQRIRPGLDYGRVMKNTMALTRALGPEHVAVSFVRQRANAGTDRAFARAWHARGVQVRMSSLSDRGGALADYRRMTRSHKPGWLRGPYARLNRLSPTCAHPFFKMDLLWDGRAILCCNDWGPREVMGDLSTQPIEAVWNGERINHHRQALWRRRPQQSAICADCSRAREASA